MKTPVPLTVVGGAEGALLLGGVEIGWLEPFHDPPLDAVVLRLELDAAPLSSPQLKAVSQELRGQLVAVAAGFTGPAGPADCIVESNRIFPIAGAEPASVLLRYGSAPPCGACRWRLGGCDGWFVDELLASFTIGYQRFRPDVDPDRIRRYVLELAASPGWQWWSLEDGERRSGVIISCGHEDQANGRPFAQCVDAVGRHSSHFSCLAAQLAASLGCEIRGEVTAGLDWAHERRVIGRLHDQGWRLRGLTSLVTWSTGRRAEPGKGGDDRADIRFGPHAGEAPAPQDEAAPVGAA